MIYRLGQATIALAVLLAFAGLGVALWGIWVGDVRGFACLVLWPASITAAFVGGTAIDESDPPLPRIPRPPRLPKAQRDELERERVRIEFDRRIKEMEKEAGLL